MFINELNGRVPLMRLARWQITAAFLMTALAASLAGGWATLGAWQVLSLAGSGLFGIALASTTYFAAIYSAGPQVTALLFSLASPSSAGRRRGPHPGRMLIAIGVRQRRPPAMIPLSDGEPS